MEARDQVLQFTIEQVRKKLISDCKKSGPHQDNKKYGCLFPMLFSLVKTRDSCQPKRAVEQWSDRSEKLYKQSGAGSPAENLGESEGSMDKGSLDDKKLFVTVKSRGQKKKCCLKCCGMY